MSLKYLCVLSLGIASSAFALNAPMSARADLSSPSNKNLKATVKFLDTKEGIKLVADVSGLKPGSVHGFHIHEVGECKGPDFKSAGDHLNPEKHNHKGPAASEKHLGDLGNIVANKSGVAHTEILIPAHRQNHFQQVIGKSVIIHEKPDDQVSQPAGDSGDRIACGVIQTDKT